MMQQREKATRDLFAGQLTRAGIAKALACRLEDANPGGALKALGLVPGTTRNIRVSVTGITPGNTGVRFVIDDGKDKQPGMVDATAGNVKAAGTSLQCMENAWSETDPSMQQLDVAIKAAYNDYITKRDLLENEAVIDPVTSLLARLPVMHANEPGWTRDVKARIVKNKLHDAFVRPFEDEDCGIHVPVPEAWRA